MTHQRHRRSPKPDDKISREIELKLAVPDASVNAIQAHLQTCGPDNVSRRHQVTTYFDTSDRALEQAGIGLRVRAAGGKRVQTLKADRRESLAADRAEWEWPIEQDEPDLQMARQVLVEHGFSTNLDLLPVFATHIDRTIRILKLDGGTIVEAAYDEGLISAGALHQPVRELELELRSGGAAPLYQLACQLNAVAPLMLEAESKGARGYCLAAGTQATACKAKDLSIESQASGGDAFKQIINACLGHLLANQAASLAGDAEGTHQMRIAIRRLRAALALFQPLLEPHAAALFQAELRRLGRVMGEARDWDVFCLQILPDVLQTPRNAGWRDLLQQPATMLRTAAHADLVAEIRSPAFTRLVLGLAAWAEDIRLPGTPEPSRPVAELCPPLLDRLATKVARRGRHIRRQSEAELHDLRKALKKLRYSIDFMRQVLPSAPLKSYLHDCKKLQTTLGEINDTVAATALAERLVKENRLDLAPAVGLLAEQLAGRRGDALQDLAKHWDGYSAQPSFWR